MYNTKTHELQHTVGLESFLRHTRRRFWFLESVSTLSVAVSFLILWSILLLLWPYRPTDLYRWMGLLVPIGLLGFVAQQSWELYRNQWKGWQSRQSQLFWLSGTGMVALMILVVPVPTIHSLYVYWWVGTSMLGGYVLWALFRLWKTTQSINMARQIERWNPHTRGYLTALELSRSLPELPKHQMFSSDLAEARIEQVQRAMQGISPVQVVPLKTFEERAVFMLLFAGIFFLSIFLAPQWTTQTLGMLILPPPLSQKSQTKTDQSVVVADLVITYRYPAYARLTPRTIQNSDGSLFALKGTEVLLRAQALEPLSRAVIVVNQQQVIPLTIGKDQQTLQGNLLLNRPGTYQFRVVTLRGTLQKGQNRSIRIQVDEKPTVELEIPKRDLEVKERQIIPLLYKFSDDFGVTSAHLVYRNLTSKRFNKTQKVLLKEFEDQPKQSQQQAEWDLQKLPFGPGDKIEYYVEVRDNDTIHGLKIGRSATRHLKIYSPLEEHDKLLKEQDKLLDQTVHFLGDLLVAPNPDTEAPSPLLQSLKKLNAKGQDVLGFFAHLLPKMRKDALTKSYTIIAMENLSYRFRARQGQRQYVTRRAQWAYSDQLAGTSQSSTAQGSGSSNSQQPEEEFPRDLIRNHFDKEVPAQEDDVYALTMLLNRQRLDILQQLATQLTQTQARVQDLLEQYRRKRDKESKAALLQELQRLERLIREINKRMQSLQRQIPDEFVNMQAFKDKSSLGKLKKLQEMIQKDNLEDAAKELSRLAKNIEEMVAQMDRYSKEAGGQSMDRMVAAMRKMMEQLQQLEQKQQRLSSRTQDVQRQVSERMRKNLQKQMERLFKTQLERTQKMKQELEQIRKSLDKDAARYRLSSDLEKLEHRHKELERMLKAGDVYESLEIIQQYQQESRWTRYALYRLQRFFQQHRNERQAALQKSQTSLYKTQELSEEIRRDLEKAKPSPQPYMTPQDRKKLDHYSHQQEQLRQEAQRLQEELSRMSKTMPMFKPSLQRDLGKARQDMRGASKQLRQNAPQPAFDHQQQAVSKLREIRRQLAESMKQQSKNGQGGKDGQTGGRRMREEDVKIPDPSAHKAPKALRQDILDAMKEKFPHQYKERVHRYYEKLAK